MLDRHSTNKELPIFIEKTWRKRCKRNRFGAGALFLLLARWRCEWCVRKPSSHREIELRDSGHPLRARRRFEGPSPWPVLATEVDNDNSTDHFDTCCTERPAMARKRTVRSWSSLFNYARPWNQPKIKKTTKFISTQVRRLPSRTDSPIKSFFMSHSFSFLLACLLFWIGASKSPIRNHGIPIKSLWRMVSNCTHRLELAVVDVKSKPSFESTTTSRRRDALEFSLVFFFNFSDN